MSFYSIKQIPGYNIQTSAKQATKSLGNNNKSGNFVTSCDLCEYFLTTSFSNRFSIMNATVYDRTNHIYMVYFLPI